MTHQTSRKSASKIFRAVLSVCVLFFCLCSVLSCGKKTEKETAQKTESEVPEKIKIKI